MGDVSAEPSMEDILSSIKRIIAEEGEGAPAARARRPARAQPPEPRAVDGDEVLELSDTIDEPAPAAAPTRDPAPAGRATDPIVSPRAAEASREQLDALSRLIVRPETTGSDTLEGLVREMLRPMLREWLDANLPDLVETLVSREISRITSQPR